ncbi:response regulator transcription factor [Desulfosarcina ovata]|uniref:DNA-binding response regulator n=1 Tax=Desulfosarcina ovata subsp. ovata TaxID=2752305 RepID=A0A5K8AJ86_9BACT|nr:response regulator transcription factor [Desulfosarcina ovata]BBO92763.1 DNA-binding response regulator [Desulfosarcina ovata subsp. ovata]
MVQSEKRPTIFICEPDHGPTHPLVAYLTAKAYDVHCIPDSSQAVDEIVTRLPDLVLLDTHLPLAGGYEVCSMVRTNYSGPILFQGQEADEASQLLAFERGADDYITMPISPALLTARIRAHLKRSHGMASGRQIRVGDLVVDAGLRAVSLDGQPIDLTTMQFELLWYLAKRSGRVVPREELYEALYNEKYNGFDRSVDVYISRIRHQLGDDADNPYYLKTVRGVGYLFAGHDGNGH